MSGTTLFSFFVGFIFNVANITSHTSHETRYACRSVAFDPVVNILPGVGFNAEDLGIEINVVGQMKAKDDEGVVGGERAARTHTHTHRQV